MENQNSTVLVVDDEVFNLEILIERLEEAGYDVVAAEDGVKAWSLIEKTPQRFNAILLDRMMPNMGGMEVLARIKAQVVAGKVYERDSIFYQAMQLGTLETVGLGWQRMDEYADRVRAITAEQVQQVAKKYLINDSLTVAVLEPLPLDNATAAH